MYIYVSLLVAIIGILMYALCDSAKLQEIGRMSFFAGLLTFLFKLSKEAVSILS